MWCNRFASFARFEVGANAFRVAMSRQNIDATSAATPTLSFSIRLAPQCCGVGEGPGAACASATRKDASIHAAVPLCPTYVQRPWKWPISNFEAS